MRYFLALLTLGITVQALVITIMVATGFQPDSPFLVGQAMAFFVISTSCGVLSWIFR